MPMSTHSPRKPLPLRPHLPGNFDRHLGEHVRAYSVEGRDFLLGISIALGIALPSQILIQNWEIAAVFLILICLNLLAARYARQAECPHILARILCAIFFHTLRNSVTRCAVRRYPRYSVLFFFGALLILALRSPFFMGHDRPPFVDPRIFSRSEFWGYLRENNFFRSPPPPENHPTP